MEQNFNHLMYDGHPCRVLQVEKDAKAGSIQFHKDSDKLHGIGFCSLEYDIPALRENGFILPADILPGTTLLRSPFNDKEYLLIAEFEDQIFKIKRNKIEEIAQLLGLQKYHFSIEFQSFEKRENKFDMNGNYKVGKADVEVKTEKEETFKKAYEQSDEFSPCELTAENYQKAIALAKQYHLYDECEELLNKRNPEHPNKLTKRTVKFSMSKETTESLDIAFKLNIMENVFNLNANFHSATEYKTSVQGIIEMEF